MPTMIHTQKGTPPSGTSFSLMLHVDAEPTPPWSMGTEVETSVVESVRQMPSRMTRMLHTHSASASVPGCGSQHALQQRALEQEPQPVKPPWHSLLEQLLSHVTSQKRMLHHPHDGQSVGTAANT